MRRAGDLGSNPFASSRLRGALLLLPLLAACGDTTLFDPMERQPKFKPFAANPQFEDGRAMRTPPAGTVPREQQTMRPDLTLGLDSAGAVVTAIPIPLTREVMDLGRTKFEIHCAVCHGLLGDGVSPVATQMSLRPPPNLHKLRNPGPGHVFQVISQGFGLMASYAPELTPQERWAVVAYLEALRRSQAATLAEAPPDIQKQLREEAAP
jgi:mono/diheme cytochrome c family protein